MYFPLQNAHHRRPAYSYIYDIIFLPELQTVVRIVFVNNLLTKQLRRFCCPRSVLRGIPRVTQDRTHFTQIKKRTARAARFNFSISGQTDACRRGTVSGVMIIELLSVQSLADSSSGVNDRELLVFVTGFLDERCLKGVENGAEGRC